MTIPTPVNVLAPIAVHYQPIVDLNTDKMVGCEALARWFTPQGELRGPGSFIASIENDFDLAVDLTRQIFHCVSRDLGGFLVRAPQFYVSINVPPILLSHGEIATLLSASELMPLIGRIVFEITERQALDETGREAIRLGRELGARVALDDFGTGQSCFRDLIGLQVDVFKLDRSFVEPLNRDPVVERLVRAFAAFAAVLGVELVGEGVETREQAAFLRAAGAQKGQGFWWSKALPAEELLARYEREQPTSAVATRLPHGTGSQPTQR